MTSASTSFRDLAIPLHEQGYDVVPIAPKGFVYKSKGKFVVAGGKAPVELGWQTFVGQTADDVRRLIRRRGGPEWGLGIQQARNPSCDIDVMHVAAAGEIHDLAISMFGHMPVRYGRAPRRMLIGRTDTPFARIKTADYVMPGDLVGVDKPHSVEVRCDRQQFVAFGTHPDTGRPYLWDGPSPLTVAREQLPVIDAEAAARFVEAAASILEKHGGQRVKTLREHGDGAPKETGELRARDPDKARDQLKAIPNDDVSRDDWVYIAHVVKGALGDDGYIDFLEWSGQSEKHHNKETVQRLWKSVEPNRIGAGTLHHLAVEAGWRGSDAAGSCEIDALNRTYAVVLVSGRAMVLKETPAGDRDFDLMPAESFRLWLKNQIAWVRGEPVPLAEFWLGDPNRRQYEGLAFAPEGAPEGYFNIWRGFAVKPRQGDCSKFLKHLSDNVCRGNDAHYRWLLGWFAELVQKPGKKVGTSVVLRGKQGAGKTKVGYVIGSLLGNHYVPVSDPRYITGRFNSHMLSCLLLHADEGFWAGDRAAEGRLKDLVTGDWHMIEPKGVDPIRTRNLVRLLVSGNPDWLVPAGMEERRFAVFDVGEDHLEDHPYFAAIDDEMDKGGREALLHYLLTFDTSGIDLRTIPKTNALLDQKLESLDPFNKWWFTTLREGRLPGGCDEANTCPVKALYQRYLDHASMLHQRSPRAMETQFGMSLRKVMPLTKGHKPDCQRYHGECRTHEDGTPHPSYVYRLAPLSACRKRFEELIKQPVPWEDDEDAPDAALVAAFGVEASNDADELDWEIDPLPKSEPGGTAATATTSSTEAPAVGD